MNPDKKALKEQLKVEEDRVKKQEDATKARDERCIPVAREIINIIASGDITLDNVTAPDGGYTLEAGDKYDIINKKVLELMLENDVNFLDRDHIFQLVALPFSIVQGEIQKALGKSFDLALENVFGKDMMDLKMSDIDKALGN